MGSHFGVIKQYMAQGPTPQGHISAHKEMGTSRDGPQSAHSSKRMFGAGTAPQRGREMGDGGGCLFPTHPPTETLLLPQAIATPEVGLFARPNACICCGDSNSVSLCFYIIFTLCVLCAYKSQPHSRSASISMDNILYGQPYKVDYLLNSHPGRPDDG